MSSGHVRTTEEPRRGRTQAERSAQSDARMLEAAVRLIVERGTERTTLKAVGELAGFSRGLAGYRFGSKAGLFRFVVKSIGEEWLRELTEVTQGKAGYEALCAAADAHYRFCVEAPEHVRAFYMLWFESIGPGSDYKEVIAGIHQRRQRDVTAWIAEGITRGRIAPDVAAQDIAAHYCATIIGIVYQWLVNPGALDEIARLHDHLKQTMASRLGYGASGT